MAVPDSSAWVLGTGNRQCSSHSFRDRFVRRIWVKVGPACTRIQGPERESDDRIHPTWLTIHHKKERGELHAIYPEPDARRLEHDAFPHAGREVHSDTSRTKSRNDGGRSTGGLRPVLPSEGERTRFWPFSDACPRFLLPRILAWPKNPRELRRNATTLVRAGCHEPATWPRARPAARRRTQHSFTPECLHRSRNRLTPLWRPTTPEGGTPFRSSACGCLERCVAAPVTCLLDFRSTQAWDRSLD